MPGPATAPNSTQKPDGYVKRQETSWYNKKILTIADPAGTGRLGRMAGACMHRWTHTQQQGPDGPDGHTQQQGPDGPDGHTHTTTRAGRARWTHTQQGPDGPDGHTHNNKGRTGQMDTHTTTRAGQARWTHTQNPDGYVKRQET